MAPRIDWTLLAELQTDSFAEGTGASLAAMKELYAGVKELVFQFAFTPDVPIEYVRDMQHRRIALSVYIKLEERLRFQIKPLDSKGKL